MTKESDNKKIYNENERSTEQGVENEKDEGMNQPSQSNTATIINSTTTGSEQQPTQQQHVFLLSYHKIEEYLKNWAHDVTLKWKDRLEQLRDILQRYSQPNILEGLSLTMDDLDEDSLYTNNTLEGDRLLNTYTIQELYEYLKKFNIISALEGKGYKHVHIVPDFSDSFVHRIKITDDSLSSATSPSDSLLIDCFVRRKDLYLSDIESDVRNGGSNVSSDVSERIHVQSTLPFSPNSVPAITTTTFTNVNNNQSEQPQQPQQFYQWQVAGDDSNSLALVSKLINFPVKASVIEWLSLQDPRQTFSNSRPPLPSQRYPGLGIARNMDDLFVFMASKSGRDCLLNTPYRFYNAFMYQAREYFFIDPKQQSFFLSLLNDLEPAIVKFGLSPVAWAFEFGCVKEINTNLPVKWEFHKQARPISSRMKQYFLSEQYITYVKRNTKSNQFYIDWDGHQSLAHFKNIQTPNGIQLSPKEQDVYHTQPPLPTSH